MSSITLEQQLGYEEEAPEQGESLPKEVKKKVPSLADSGDRTTYDSGAMREITEEKGRCDLMPLSIVCKLLSDVEEFDCILCNIGYFINSSPHDTTFLYRALRSFIGCYYPNEPTAMLELSFHYRDGAKKYAERNWEKGLPLHTFIDSGVRHYLKVLRGDTDEPHKRAFMWNIIGAIWTLENSPENDDIKPPKFSGENDKNISE